MIVRYYFSGVLLVTVLLASAQQDSAKIVDGWSFGGLPVLAYNADFGLKYGAVGNLYYYGDGGARYPYYDHSIYLAVTNTTNGESKVRLKYDARQLIPEGRFNVRLLRQFTLYRPFYGFNGYESLYQPELTSRGGPDFASPVYYTYQQKTTDAFARIDKNLRGKQLRVQGGVRLTQIKINPATVESYNKGKSPENQVKDTITYFEQLVDWGVIDSRDQDGGSYLSLTAGGVVDTRDIEPWPSRGLWEEVTVRYGIPLDGVAWQALSLSAVHRHYFTLIRDRLVFAHRLQYKTFLSDDVPFYILQLLGGEKDLRGIRYARLAGTGEAAGNVEIRWKVAKRVLFNQNIYVGINVFMDAGMVTRRFDIDTTGVPDAYQYYVSGSREKLHQSAGFGVKVAVNENFVVSTDYGRALDTRDGDDGMYISLGWLF